MLFIIVNDTTELFNNSFSTKVQVKQSDFILFLLINF